VWCTEGSTVQPQRLMQGQGIYFQAKFLKKDVSGLIQSCKIELQTASEKEETLRIG